MNILYIPFNIISKASHNIQHSMGRLRTVGTQTDSYQVRMRSDYGFRQNNSQNDRNNIEREVDSIARTLPVLVPYKSMIVDLLTSLHDELVDPTSGNIEPMKIFTVIGRLLGIRNIDIQLEPDSIANSLT